jgi:hypothetical protein
MNGSAWIGVRVHTWHGWCYSASISIFDISLPPRIAARAAASVYPDQERIFGLLSRTLATYPLTPHSLMTGPRVVKL